MAKYYKDLFTYSGDVQKDVITTVSDYDGNQAYKINMDTLGPKIVPAAYSNIKAITSTPQPVNSSEVTDLYTPIVLLDSGSEFTVTYPTCTINVNVTGWYLITGRVSWTSVSWAYDRYTYLKLRSLTVDPVEIVYFNLQATNTLQVNVYFNTFTNLLSTSGYYFQVIQTKDNPLDIASAEISVTRMA